MNAPRHYRRRKAAAEYIRERWGLPCQPSWLAKLAVVGGGPVFRRCGRFPVYDDDALDAWARSRLSGPMRSTSYAAASDYEKASRREQESFDRERTRRDMHKRAVALARDVYDDHGSDVSRIDFDKAGQMYGADLDHAWEIYAVLADRN